MRVWERLIAATFVLAGCDLNVPNDRSACTGRIEVNPNVVPDTVTLRMGGPEVRYNMPDVFRQTEGRPLDYGVGGTRADFAEFEFAGTYSNVLVMRPVRPDSAFFALNAVDVDCSDEFVEFFLRVR